MKFAMCSRCLVTPRKSTGNKLTRGWGNSYVPCHTTIPLFLSPPAPFFFYFLVFAGLYCSPLTILSSTNDFQKVQHL